MKTVTVRMIADEDYLIINGILRHNSLEPVREFWEPKNGDQWQRIVFTFRCENDAAAARAALARFLALV
jgi:hypothetical protein